MSSNNIPGVPLSHIGEHRRLSVTCKTWKLWEWQLSVYGQTPCVTHTSPLSLGRWSLHMQVLHFLYIMLRVILMLWFKKHLLIVSDLHQIVPLSHYSFFYCLHAFTRHKMVHASTSSSKIPRPMNCFLAFRLEKQQEIISRCPGANHRDISKIIAKWWKSMPDEEKEPYRERARLAKNEHAKR